MAVFRNPFDAPILGEIKKVAEARGVAPSNQELADLADCTLHQAQETTARLARHKVLEIEYRGRAVRRFVVDGKKTEWAAPAGSRTRALLRGAQMRECLSCQNSFISEHKGNRLCSNCRWEISEMATPFMA